MTKLEILSAFTLGIVTALLMFCLIVLSHETGGGWSCISYRVRDSIIEDQKECENDGGLLVIHNSEEGTYFYCHGHKTSTFYTHE